MEQKPFKQEDLEAKLKRRKKKRIGPNGEVIEEFVDFDEEPDDADNAPNEKSLLGGLASTAETPKAAQLEEVAVSPTPNELFGPTETPHPEPIIETAQLKPTAASPVVSIHRTGLNPPPHESAVEHSMAENSNPPEKPKTTKP